MITNLYNYLALKLIFSVNAAYEASGKRTCLPNIILIATFLPFLLGLCALYRTLVKLHKTIHPDTNSQETSQ